MYIKIYKKMHIDIEFVKDYSYMFCYVRYIQ